MENSKSWITFEASATYSLPRALRKTFPSVSSRDVWVFTKRKSLAMSETSISASRSNVQLRTQVAIESLPPSPVAQAS